MTRKFKNAVSRLQKLQKAALAGEINNFMCVMVQLNSYLRRYEDHDHFSLGVVIAAYKDEDNCKRLHWDVDDDICEIVDSGDDTMTHEEFLQYVSQFLDYTV